jgi:recombination protein RecT
MNAPNRNVGQRKQDPTQLAIKEAMVQVRQMEHQFVDLLPRTVPSEKFIRMVSTCLHLKPELTRPNVNRQSLMLAFIRCAADGLLPDGREATITTFNEGEDEEQKGDGSRQKQAVYMPMYQGLIKQIRNTGELKSIAAHIVYDKDPWKHTLGDSEKIEHEAAKGPRGKPIKVYAVLHTKDGGIYRAVLDQDDIGRLKAKSQMGKKDKGPWKTDWEEMWKKSAIRRLSKHAPKSAELDRYLEVVREQDDPVGQRLQRLEDAPMPDGESGSEQIEAQLFQLKAGALEAMSVAETPQLVSQVWDQYVSELKKIGQNADVEVEGRRNDRLEVLKQGTLLK